MKSSFKITIHIKVRLQFRYSLQFKMFRRIFLVYFLLLVLFVCRIASSRFESCSAGQVYGDGNAAKYFLNHFENNSPKSDEIFRIKQYYKYSSPFFSVHDSGTDSQFVFGN